MSTSLSLQLQRLKAPQTQVLATSKKGVSLLFDSREAENTTFDTAFDLGLEGLRELQKFEPKFKEFEDVLFNESSKSLQRAVQSADVNSKLDGHIRKFLLLLSPHLLLKPALSALEWLVHRFQIGEYNAEDLILTSLPYHGTRTFVLLLRAVPGIKTPQSHWHWLRAVADTGTPLDAHSIHVVLASNTALLRMVCDFALLAHKTYPRGEANKLQTLFSFCCTSLLGVMQVSKGGVSQAQLACMLPLLRAGLASNTSCFVAGCLAVTVHLVTTTALAERINHEITTQLASVKVSALQHEAGSVLLLLFTAQVRLGAMPPSLPSHTLAKLQWLPACLGKLSQPQEGKRKVDVAPLMLGVLAVALPEITFLPSAKANQAAQLVINLVQEVSLDPEPAEIVIRAVFDNLPGKKSRQMEIEWFQDLCNSLEVKFPESFDKETRRLLNEGKKASKRLKLMLGVQAISLGKGQVTTTRGMLRRLEHPEETVRAAAVECLGKIYSQLPVEEQMFVKQAVQARLEDDSMLVVIAVLKVSDLVHMLGGSEELCEAIVHLLDVVPYKKWTKEALQGALNQLGEHFEANGVELRELCVLQAILPHVIRNPAVFSSIADSKFSNNCAVLQNLKQKVEMHKHIPTELVLLEEMHSAFSQSPQEALFLVSWRLKCSTLSSLELLLLCKMLQSAASKLNSMELALQCCKLVLIIKTRLQKVNILMKSSQDTPKFKTAAKLYKEVVTNNSFPIESFMKILLTLASKQLRVLGDIKPRAHMSKKQDTSILRWCDIWKGGSGDLQVTVMEVCAQLVPVLLQYSSLKCEYSHLALSTFLEVNTPTLELQLHLLSQLWCRPGLADEDRVRCLKFAASLIKYHKSSKANLLQVHSECILVPSLIFALCHREQTVRKVAMMVIKEVILLSENSQFPSFYPLLVALLSREEEILMDESHLSVAFYSLLSPEMNLENKVLRSQKSVLYTAGCVLLQHCCSELTPPSIRATLLKALCHVRSEEYLITLAPLGCRLLALKPPDMQLDAVTWGTLQLLLERIDESTAHLLLQDQVWQFFSDALQSTLQYQTNLVASSAIGLVTKDLFNVLPEEHEGRLLFIALSLGSEMLPAVSALLRRVVLTGPLLVQQLQLMAPPTEKQPRRGRSVGVVATPPVPVVTSTAGWTRGLILLEALQQKKKLVNVNKVIPVLLRILKTSLEAEGEQEYCKQLVLGCLSNCLKHLEKIKGCQLDIELIVQCLRGTTNPQTQHQALLLLCLTANTVPEGLLHHLVSVFTFMGSLVMRHDDAYSFHVIAEVIDKVLPVILQAQQGSVAAILRVFVDAMPDVPAHRREPIFSRLMAVLGWQHLWLFLGLVLEGKQVERSSPRLICALELTRDVDMLDLLTAVDHLITYLGILATIKYGENKQVLDSSTVQARLKACGASELQDPITHSAKDTRRLQISGLSFLSDLLATRLALDIQSEELSPEMEEKYQLLMETLMSYLNILTKEEQAGRGTPTAKFWPAMLHHAYALLNKVNMLLPTRQFLGVVRGVLGAEGGSEGVRSKTLELLGARLQLKGSLADAEKSELLELVPTLKSLALSSESSADKALFCLRIMARQLAATNAHTFVPVMKSLMDVAGESATPTMLANAMLCLAELCASLKAQAVPNLTRLVPLVLAASTHHRQPFPDSSELVVLAAAAAMQRLVETLPLFLSPFLPTLLRELCLLSAPGAANQMSAKASAALQPRLAAIKECVGKISLRILLPAVKSVFAELRDSDTTLPALTPLMQLLAKNFANLERVDTDAHISELTDFFQVALELRSVWDSEHEEVPGELIKQAEDQVIAALVALILKLPEGVFRPLYFKLSSWSSQAELTPSLRSRCITFYRCSTSLAASLKGLFVVFAFYFLKQAAALLQRCHSASQEEAFLKTEVQNCLLLDSVLETLLTVFSHDKQNFVNKECFDVLMQPLVDQLENMVGGETLLRERCRNLVSPCLAQFAKATADDVLWKQLNYQVLLKTRHTTPTVRLVAVGAVQALAEALGEELLPLLPEAVPFLAELLEDEEDEVETACQDAVREMERILGEPLQKYF